MLLTRLNNIEKIKLSSTNKKIADYLRHNPSEARMLSSSAMANKLKISQSTISRFATGIMGYASFKDMQMDVFPDSAIEETQEIIINDSIETIQQKIKFQYKNMADLTSKLNTTEEIEKIVKLIRTSRHVICFGMGNSGCFAEYLSSRLIRLGIYSSFLQDYKGAASLVANSSIEDCVVIMSETGTTPEIIRVANIANSLHIPIVGFTKYADSPLAKLSDIVLLTFNGTHNFNVDSITMRCSQLYLIDVIFFSLISLDSEKFIPIINESSRT